MNNLNKLDAYKMYAHTYNNIYNIYAHICRI